MLYSNILFVDALSGQLYSSLLFYAAVFTLIAFSIQFVSERHYKIFYTFSSLMIVVAAVGLLFTSDSKVLIYLLAISAMVNDIVSINYYPLIIQEAVKPSQFQSVFGSFSKAEILGKIVVGGLAFVLAQFQLLHLAAWSLVVFALFHTFYFERLYSKYYAPQLAPKTNENAEELQPSNTPVLSFAELMASSWYIFKESQLARLSLYLVLWSTSMKFFVDTSYFQAVGQQISGKSELAAYISSVDITLNVGSFLLVQYLTPFFLKRFSLTQALSVLPIAMILLGLAALLFDPLFFTTALMVSYYSFFRALHRPLSRQCTAVLPTSVRRRVAIFFTVTPSLLSFFIASGIKLAGPYIDVTNSLMLMTFGATILFVIISQLDSHYVRSLWSQSHENQLTANTMIFGDSILSGLQETESTSESSNSLSRSQLHKIRIDRDIAAPFRQAYHMAYSPKILLATARNHALMVFTHEGAIRDELSALLYNFKPSIKDRVFHFLRQHLAYDFFKSAHYLTKIRPIEEYMRAAQKTDLNLIVQRHFREYLEKIIQRPSYAHFHKVAQILKCEPLLIQDLVDVLLAHELNDYHAYIFEGLQTDGRYSLEPIIENLTYLSFKEGAPLRAIIADLAKHDEVGIEKQIGAFYERLRSIGFHLNRPETYGHGDRQNLDVFLNTVYLSELILRPKGVAKMVRGSVEQLAQREHAEHATLVEIHRRLLLNGRSVARLSAMM